MVESQLSELKRVRLEKQRYRLVGNHSAVKICFWCKRSIQGKGCCYKNDFYGVDSRRCLEMSPAITCNKRCRHCWRDTSVFSKGWVGLVDEPIEIVQNCIKARAKLLNGFRGSKIVGQDVVDAALAPNNVAISLTGEPMMYPRYSELVKEFFRAGFETVFAVTSGTVPEMIKKLDVWPTNVYLSVEAWCEDLFLKCCIPVVSNAWDLFLESAELLSSAPTRTVMRITCMKGINMDCPEKFAFLVEKMNPDVIECKAYSWMGYSRQRLAKENSPKLDAVSDFAGKLAKAVNYDVVYSRLGSDVVLLRRPVPRIVCGQEFLYVDLKNEKLWQADYLKRVRAKS